MYARVTTMEGSPDKMDDATGHLREQTLPQLQQMDGFEGFADRDTRPGTRPLAPVLYVRGCP
jgi:hypothetical protein